MSVINKILLPLDGSKSAFCALQPAKCIALKNNATIEILYVSNENISKENLINKLGLKGEDLSNMMISHKKGDVVEVIAKESQNAQIVIMCTHGEECDLEKTMGSTTEKVMEVVKTPIIILKPNMPLNIKGGCWVPKKILIPLNGTPGSSQALLPAFEFLAKAGSDIELLHITCTSPAVSKEEGCFTAPYYQDYQQHEWPSWSKEFMKRFCEVQQNNSSKVKLKLSLASGDPAEEILKWAKEKENDFLVMAWHGKLGPLRAETLKKIIKEMPCPVLLTKIHQ